MHFYFNFIVLTGCWLLISLVFLVESIDDDPYQVLGVKKSASDREVRKAYHRMSKLHHPDKNRNDPSANERFSKINEAYEILSDPEKRKHYDMFGTTAPPGQDSHHGFHSPGSFFFHQGGGGGFGGDPFEFMFNFGGFGGGGGGGGGAGDTMRVNRRVVESKIIPESVTKPALILAKAHMCFQCGPISQLWNRIADELSGYGVTMATAYLDEPGGLAELLRLSSVPAIIGITNKRIFNYASYETGREISISSLIGFLRKMLPNNLLEQVTDQNFASNFVADFEDGRIRVLLGYSAPVSQRNSGGTLVPPPLRFALAAFRHRLQAKFACLRIDQLYSKDSQNLFEKFQLPRIGETISLLDENYEKTGPVYKKFTNPNSNGAAMELSAAQIDAIIQQKGFLSLPRIFSSHMLGLICPPESEVDADFSREITVCVLLLVDKRAPLPKVIDQFRQFGERFRHEKGGQIPFQLRFTYVLTGVQTGFASALRSSRGVPASSNAAGHLDVAIFKQKEPNQLMYDFVEAAWDSSNPEESEFHLGVKLLKFKTQRRFPYFARIPELLDENRESLISRIIWRLTDWSDRLQFVLTSSDAPMFYVTILCTVFVGLGSVVLHSVLSAVRGLMGVVRESSADHTDPSSDANLKHPQIDKNRMLNVQLFCAETCDRLVKELPRGELAIVLLTTREMQAGLLQAFVEAITAFTKYHRLRFAFMDLDLPENTRWYQKLLSLSLGREIDISWERCAGTVLAINGYRDYYCLYHPAYRSISTIGRFAGLEEDDPHEQGQENRAGGWHSDPKKMLRHLPPWLDSLLEGTLKRFRVEQWPNMAEIVAQLHNDDSGAAS